MAPPSRSSFSQLPATHSGWWAAGLAAACVLVFIFNLAIVMVSQGNSPNLQISLPNLGILVLLLGLASGVLGLIALIKKYEHSWLIWLSLLLGVMMLFLILREFLPAH